jgi:hypothetical protein
MRGLMTEAAVLAASIPPGLPRRTDPMAAVPVTDWADGIWWTCAWCLSDNRLIAMDPVRPGESLTAGCDYCERLTEIVRRTAMFA